MDAGTCGSLRAFAARLRPPLAPSATQSALRSQLVCDMRRSDRLRDKSYKVPSDQTVQGDDILVEFDDESPSRQGSVSSPKCESPYEEHAMQTSGQHRLVYSVDPPIAPLQSFHHRDVKIKRGQHHSGRLPPETWPDAHAPDSSRSLVMAPVTVNKIRKWLKQAVSTTEASPSSPRALLLTGPPGAGKSAAVRTVTNELGCELCEWQAPFVSECRGSTSRVLLESIQDFLIGVQYPSLIASVSDSAPSNSPPLGRVLLLDDLPRSLSETIHSQVGKFIGLAMENCIHPIILILSDSSKARSKSTRALGLDPADSPNVLTINVPPATESAMSRVLTAAAKRQRREILPDSLNYLIQSSHGDIRAALNTLYLYALPQSYGSVLDVSVDTSDVPKKRKKKEAKRSRAVRSTRTLQQPLPVDHVPGIGSDASLDTFHAVSKVLNNKRRENGLSKYDPEKVLADSHAEPAAFVSFLHQNYARFFSKSSDAAEALEILSESELLLQWRQDDVSRMSLADCAASIVTRGFLFHNSDPIQTGWRPIQGPESFAVLRAASNRLGAARQCSKLTGFEEVISLRTWATDMAPYRQAMGLISDASGCLPESKELLKYVYHRGFCSQGVGGLAPRATRAMQLMDSGGLTKMLGEDKSQCMHPPQRMERKPSQPGFPPADTIARPEADSDEDFRDDIEDWDE